MSTSRQSHTETHILFGVIAMIAILCVLSIIMSLRVSPLQRYELTVTSKDVYVKIRCMYVKETKFDIWCYDVKEKDISVNTPIAVFIRKPSQTIIVRDITEQNSREFIKGVDNTPKYKEEE